MGDLSAGVRKTEPPGSAVDVEETWLPGNWLVTKKAEGQGKPLPESPVSLSFGCK